MKEQINPILLDKEYDLPVSYTHLDVYKRQLSYWVQLLQLWIS